MSMPFNMLYLYQGELFLIVIIFLLFLMPVSLKQHTFLRALFIICTFTLIALLGIFLASAYELSLTPNFRVDEMIINEGTQLLKAIVVVLALIILFPVLRMFKLQRLTDANSFLGIYFSALLASLLLINAGGLMVGYLLLEIQALSFYLLVSFNRYSTYSSEAGMKYFIIGSIFSSLFLFACSVLYGLFGTLNLYELKYLLELFIDNKPEASFFFLANFAGFLLIVVFLHKTLSAPFHLGLPDIYEGAPMATTIIISILPKLSIYYFFLKIINILTPVFPNLITLGLFSGTCTLLLGVGAALKHLRVKRFFIYASIAQGGFLTVLSVMVGQVNIEILFFFLINYLFTSCLLWILISRFYEVYATVKVTNTLNFESLYLSDFAKFVSLNKYLTIPVVVVVLSMAGLPLFIGFFAKLGVFSMLLLNRESFITTIFILTGPFSMYYYLRIIKISVFETKGFDNKKDTPLVLLTKYTDNRVEGVVITFLVAFIILNFFSPGCLSFISKIISISCITDLI